MGGDGMIKKELYDKLIVITDEERAILGGDTAIQRQLYMEGKADIINVDKLLPSGKLIAIRPHTRFINFPPHSHDYIEMVYVLSGSLVHVINGNKVTLREGELLLLGKGAVHEIRAAGEKDVAVNFIIRPSFFDRTLNMIGQEETPIRRFVVDSLREGQSQTGYLHFKVADILPITNLVENLIYTIQRDMLNKRLINQTTMGLLFMQLLNYTDHLSQGSKDEDTIIRVYRYIEENYRTATLAEIADMLYYNLNNLSRSIKEKTGFTFTELLQEKRLSQAAYLLKNTEIKVSNISRAVGYENVSYFHRIFAQKYGVSPKKFRDTL